MSMEYKGGVKMYFSMYLEQKRKQLKDRWEASKTRSELENAYKTTCELLLKEQEENHERQEMMMTHIERERNLIDTLDDVSKELGKYKKMYADELQKRLELAKLVEEMGDKINE